MNRFPIYDSINNLQINGTAGVGTMGQLRSLVDRVFAVHVGRRGFDSHRRHLSERFFRSNWPEYAYTVCSLSWKNWYQSGGRWLQCHWTSAVASDLSNRQSTTRTEVMYLIWFHTLGRWPHETSTTGTTKGRLVHQTVYSTAVKGLHVYVCCLVSIPGEPLVAQCFKRWPA